MHAQYMLNTYSIHAQYMLNICSIYSQCMPNICSIYAQAARMTVKLDGDIIMGEIAATADKRYLNPQYGSLEDMG